MMTCTRFMDPIQDTIQQTFTKHYGQGLVLGTTDTKIKNNRVGNNEQRQSLPARLTSEPVLPGSFQLVDTD